MRILMKPEISSWRIFLVGGKGVVGEFWFPPSVVVFALFLFYLEGRGKLRPLYHTLLIGWHSVITGAMVYGSMQSDRHISFDTWGIELSFIWFVLPLGLFTVLAIIMVVNEHRGIIQIPEYKWTRIDWKTLAIAAVLLPISFILFRFGEGFNWITKFAVATTIFQWILLADGLGRPSSS